jgi:hypothetical protein
MSLDDRMTAALLAVIRSAFPRLAFLGVFEYRVLSCLPPKLSATPVDTSLGLPRVVQIDMRGSILGGEAMLAPGMSVLVSFVNGDPRRACVVGGDVTTQPLTVSLCGGTPLQGVARIGDTVVVAGTAGLITTGSLRVRCG